VIDLDNILELLRWRIRF